jgi:hypothetical protein
MSVYYPYEMQIWTWNPAAALASYPNDPECECVCVQILSDYHENKILKCQKSL